MDRQPILEGSRLLLRPLREDDWEALYAVASDPQIWAVHPSPDRWKEAVFRQFFADAMACGGALVVVDKASGEVIGSSQFGKPESQDSRDIEIGRSFLARARWGGGYNAELKRLMLGHALAHYDRAIFQVGEDNIVSRKAMANIGGVLTDQTCDFERTGRIVRHVIYEITREGFASGPLS